MNKSSLLHGFKRTRALSDKPDDHTHTKREREFQEQHVLGLFCSLAFVHSCHVFVKKKFFKRNYYGTLNNI